MVLSRDLSFSPIILATAGQRDVKKLQEGKVVVELCCEGGLSDELFTGTFLTLESINFFGKYKNTLEVSGQNLNRLCMATTVSPFHHHQ